VVALDGLILSFFYYRDYSVDNQEVIGQKIIGRSDEILLANDCRHEISS
jgi:hypothetical protein